MKLIPDEVSGAGGLRVSPKHEPEVVMGPIEKLLRAAHDKIKDQKHWCQGTLRRTRAYTSVPELLTHPCIVNELDWSESVTYTVEHVTQYCSMGALLDSEPHASANPLGAAAHIILNQTCRSLTGMDIVGFNDHASHKAVMSVWKAAIEEAHARHC